MFGLTPGEIVASLIAVGQSVFIFVNRQAFMKGRSETKLDQLDVSYAEIVEMRKKLNELEVQMSKYQTKTSEVELVNREQEIAIRGIEKAVVVQGQSIIHMERMLERVSVQHSEFQKNLNDNTNALNKMSGTMDGIKKLLENLITGKLTFSKHE